MPPTDREKNRFSARAKRYAKVGTKVGTVAARIASQRLVGAKGRRAGNAFALASALGGLKGPIMKVAQLLATIPDALPAEYAGELMKLQSQAPPMGWAFVKRRMQAELGAGWENKFANFEHRPAAAASLGQVHRATAKNGAELAWLLDPSRKTVEIYRPGREVEVLEGGSAVEGDGPVAGFVLELGRIWA